MGNIGGKLSKKEVDRLRSLVDISEEQIQKEYDKFKKCCQKGRKITKAEFTDIYAEMFQGDAKEFAENIFRSFDKDKNGTIDFAEYLVGLCLISSKDVEKKLKWAFNIYDINGDGTIDKGEMATIIKAVYRLHDMICPGEQETEVVTQDIFRKLDTNKDERISLEEFQAGAMSDPRVMHLLQGQTPQSGDQVQQT